MDVGTSGCGTVLLRHQEQRNSAHAKPEVSPPCLPQYHQACSIWSGHNCYTVLVFYSSVARLHHLYSKKELPFKNSAIHLN